MHYELYDESLMPSLQSWPKYVLNHYILDDTQEANLAGDSVCKVCFPPNQKEPPNEDRNRLFRRCRL
jgi:hypothetical protein